ncbi:MAG: hypothetical protein K8S21_04345 [Gemmatimonadetes bacterium]|nr:hypothetical protein [Gemmatimonadota bacterium]
MTTPLRRALKLVFYASVADAGFAIDRRGRPGTTVLRRVSGDVVHLLEVQWEKYGRPRFTLNFGTCPAAGLRIRDELHVPGQVLPTWCPDAGTLRPRRGATSRSWFRQDRPFLQRLLGRPALREPSEVVGELVTLFPELERYWSTGEIGEHMRVWDLPVRPASTSSRGTRE